MKYLFPMALLVDLAISTTNAQAALTKEKMVLSGSTACQAKVLSKNSMVLPNHCLENDKILMIENHGSRTIINTDRKTPYFGAGSEHLVTVELKENIFPEFDQVSFGTPFTGEALVRLSGVERRCQILTVDVTTKTFTHDCAQFKGESGTSIYQNGKLVGIHLGRLRQPMTSIAAMKNGPDFRKNMERFESYEAQGLKIRCCKRIEKAIKNVGDVISKGAEAVKDFAESAANNANDEISRLSKDLASMPKVFSVEYVQKRLPEVKLPQLPQIEMDQSILDGNRYKWDVPTLNVPNLSHIEITKNSVIGKIAEAITKGLKDTGNALSKAGHDIGRWWPDTLEWIRSKARINYPDDCDDLAAENQMKSCISKLEAEVRDLEAELKRSRDAAAIWINDQHTTVGM